MGAIGLGLDARLTTLIFKKYCCGSQGIEIRMKSGRIFYGKLLLKKGWCANDDEKEINKKY
jgi:hypothetical protein